MQLSAHSRRSSVVGIGYRAGSLIETTEQRTATSRPRTIRPSPTRFPGQSVMGGADRFLAFIGDELRPWVQDRFGVDACRFHLFRPLSGGPVWNIRAPHRAHSRAIRHRESAFLVARGNHLRGTRHGTREGHDTSRPRCSTRSGEYENYDGRPARVRKAVGPLNGPRHHSATSTWWRTTERLVASLRTREYPEPRDGQCGPPRGVPHHGALMNLSRVVAVSISRDRDPA